MQHLFETSSFLRLLSFLFFILTTVEKDTNSDLEALEEKVGELIDSECTRRLDALRSELEEKLAAAQQQLDSVGSELKAVEQHQHELEDETHAEEGKLEGELQEMNGKIAALLEDGGLAEAIREGAGPAIAAVGEKLDSDIRSVGKSLQQAASQQRAELLGLDERLSGEAKALREKLEGGVAGDLGKLATDLAGLQGMAEQRMGQMGEDLARQASGE